jgi:hypothetical protein
MTTISLLFRPPLKSLAMVNVIHTPGCTNKLKVLGMKNASVDKILHATIQSVVKPGKASVDCGPECKYLRPCKAVVQGYLMRTRIAEWAKICLCPATE